MTAATPDVSVESLREVAEAAKQEWLAEKEEAGGIERHVWSILDGKIEAVVASFLGFDRRWGSEWELDHCNGRQGNSFVGAEVRARAAEKAQQWVAEALEGVELRAEQRDAIRKEFRDELARHARDYARALAQRQVEAEVEAALAETVPEAKPVFDDTGEQIGTARFKDGRWVMEVSS